MTEQLCFRLHPYTHKGMEIGGEMKIYDIMMEIASTSIRMLFSDLFHQITNVKTDN